MASLLDEKELSAAEREVYSAILSAHAKTVLAAPNILISLADVDAAELARIQQIADKRPDVCALAQLKEPVILGPKQSRYAGWLAACYSPQSLFPQKLKMDKSAYPQTNSAVIRDFQQKLPNLVREVTFVDFPAVGMPLRDFVRDAAKIKQEL